MKGSTYLIKNIQKMKGIRKIIFSIIVITVCFAYLLLLIISPVLASLGIGEKILAGIILIGFITKFIDLAIEGWEEYKKIKK